MKIEDLIKTRNELKASLDEVSRLLQTTCPHAPEHQLKEYYERKRYIIRCTACELTLERKRDVK